MSEAPASAVDICNLALDHVGQPPISDIDEPTTTTEVLLARWYDQCRQKVLRSYLWNFAQKSTTLARADDGVGGYEDAYRYPIDCLKINILSSDYITDFTDMSDWITEYEISSEDEGGRTISVDNGGNTLYLRYTSDITNVSMMDPLFIDVLALELALKIAYPITKKKSEVERISNLLALELPKAISIDGQERPPRRISHSQFASARRIGARSNQTWRGFFDND